MFHFIYKHDWYQELMRYNFSTPYFDVVTELSTSIVAGSVGTPYTGLPKKTPPSPAQLDPFYTQG